MKIAIVVWDDAHAIVDGSWTHLSELDDEDPYTVVSIGILLDVGRGGKPGHVSLAQSLTPDEFVDHITHIPQAMVKSVIDLYEIGVHDGQVRVHESGSGGRTRVPEARRRPRK
jgi:hypothetical protein